MDFQIQELYIRLLTFIKMLKSTCFLCPLLWLGESKQQSQRKQVYKWVLLVKILLYLGVAVIVREDISWPHLTPVVIESLEGLIHGWALLAFCEILQKLN